MELQKKVDYRNAVTQLEEKFKKIEGALVGEEMNKHNPLKHTFCEGYYVREISAGANQFLISKIHKFDHPYFLMKGECSVLTEEGPIRIKAPYYGITKAGTKRVVYVNSDMIWVTVHATENTDLDTIEEEIIAKDFNDPAIDIKILKQLKNK
tara:strand:- start:142 stop:597 length:456 start_codon:yes stop_codon:yes gene_type:complete